MDLPLFTRKPQLDLINWQILYHVIDPLRFDFLSFLFPLVIKLLLVLVLFVNLFRMREFVTIYFFVCRHNDGFL